MDAADPVGASASSQNVIKETPIEGNECWRRCEPCDVDFTTRRAYKRHLKTTQAHVHERHFRCSRCNAEFRRRDIRNRHEARKQCPLEEESVANFGQPLLQQWSLRNTQQLCGAPAQPLLTLDKELEGSESQRDPGLESMDWAFANDFFGSADRPGVLTEGLSYFFDDSIFSLAPLQPSKASGAQSNSSPEVQSPLCSMRSYEVGLDDPTDTPDLSRGGSAASDHPELEESISEPFKVDMPDEDQTLQSLSESVEHGLLHPHSYEEAQAEVKSPRNTEWPSQHSKKPVRCPLCKQKYEDDQEKISSHGNQHLHDLCTAPHSCEACGVRFVHLADLQYHLSSGENERCGFPFQHSENGAEANVNAPTDVEKAKSRRVLQEWEHSQLRLVQSSVQRAMNTSLATRLSHFSIRSSPLVRNSVASLVYSLRSFKSETRDVDYSARLDEVERGVAGLDIRKENVVKRWQRRRELAAINTQIREATLRDDAVAIERLLDKGGDVNGLGERSPAGTEDFTSLMLAARDGCVNAAECLVRRGADVRATNSKGKTALHVACSNGNALRMPMLYDLDGIFVPQEPNSPREDPHGPHDATFYEEQTDTTTHLGSNIRMWSYQKVAVTLWAQVKSEDLTWNTGREPNWLQAALLGVIDAASAMDQALESGRVDMLCILLYADAMHRQSHIDFPGHDASTACLKRIISFLTRRASDIVYWRDRRTRSRQGDIVLTSMKQLDSFIIQLLDCGAFFDMQRLLQCPESATFPYIAIVCELEETIGRLRGRFETFTLSNETNQRGNRWEDGNGAINFLVHGETILCAAARKGYLQVVQALLAAGADPVLCEYSVASQLCEHCSLGRNLACPLKESVNKQDLKRVQSRLDRRVDIKAETEEPDYFGALYLAITQGSATIARTILRCQQWEISANSSTALLEIVIALGSKRTIDSDMWFPWRYLVLLDICDALISAGARVSPSSRCVLLMAMRDVKVPDYLTHVKNVIAT